MRVLLVLIAALIVGCAQTKTLEELELAALESGHWSAVEQRERVLAERRARNARACPGGYVLVCGSSLARKECYCSSHDSVRDLLSSL